MGPIHNNLKNMPNVNVRSKKVRLWDFTGVSIWTVYMNMSCTPMIPIWMCGDNHNNNNTNNNNDNRNNNDNNANNNDNDNNHNDNDDDDDDE